MNPNHMTVRTFTLDGVHARPATIEVAVSQTLPSFQIVGLGDRAEQETRERVTAAIATAGTGCRRTCRRERRAGAHPARRRRLQPADRLRDPRRDRPGPRGPARHVGLWGDLELSGELRGVRGSLAVAQAAARIGLDGLVVAAATSRPRGSRTASPSTAPDAARRRAAAQRPPARRRPRARAARPRRRPRQRHGDPRRDVAAAGAHHLLLTGQPGSGRTMLARRVPGILPPLTRSDALEVARIHDIAGTVDPRRVPATRPFRAPHHSISTSGLIGGGAVPAPGEVSLAHHGVLYLDEVDQFARSAMAALTAAVDDREVVMHRGERCTVLPCDVLLVASVGDCACGHRGEQLPLRPERTWSAGAAACSIASAPSCRSPRQCPRRPPTSSPHRRRRRRLTRGCSSRSRASARPNAPPRPAPR